jgi:hypothetical protein
MTTCQKNKQPTSSSNKEKKVTLERERQRLLLPSLQQNNEEGKGVILLPSL